MFSRCGGEGAMTVTMGLLPAFTLAKAPAVLPIPHVNSEKGTIPQNYYENSVEFVCPLKGSGDPQGSCAALRTPL